MCVCVCVCVCVCACTRALCFPSIIDFRRKMIFGDKSFYTLVESLCFIAEKSETRGSQGHSLTANAKSRTRVS